MAKTKSKFEIRNLRSSDRNDLIANELSIFDEAKNDVNFGQILEKKRPTISELRKWFTKCLRTSSKGESIDLVAVLNGRVMALCSVDKVGYGYETEHVGELGITIVKEGRNIGIGKALVREIIKKARERYEILEATGIFSNNKAAIRLYEGAGFKTCAVMSRHMKRGNKYFDEIRMSLRLK